MAVNVICDNPQQLLGEIKSAVTSGRVKTWQLDKDGDFTHSPPQWLYKAWLHPNVEADRLTFNILGATTERTSKQVYAVYHGRFIEMLLTHFDEKFESASATALATTEDVVTGE
jgi:hypothetical protein